jgi:3-deoxy-D-manno-octulosonate 8-phosphate phosphatase (KDO 8-P phosphatase)
VNEALAGKPRIELLATDIDGVLTDGGMYFGVEGQVMKRFDVKDGYGLARVRDAGVKIAFISTDSSEIGVVRGEKLRVTEVCVGVPDKRGCLQELLARWGLRADQAVFVGDDLLDLVVRDLVGTFVAPADAVPEVRAQADYVTRASGGHGAMREVCDAIVAHNSTMEQASDA